MKQLFIIVTLLFSWYSFTAEEWSVGGINHFGLAVTDLQASRDFFVQELGFEVLGGDPDYPSVFVANDEIMVTLWRVSDPANAVTFDRKNNVGLHHVAFNISSFEALDALYETLLETKGVVVEFAPELLGSGPAKHMMIREPSGNRLEFIHQPQR